MRAVVEIEDHYETALRRFVRHRGGAMSPPPADIVSGVLDPSDYGLAAEPIHQEELRDDSGPGCAPVLAGLVIFWAAVALVLIHFL